LLLILNGAGFGSTARCCIQLVGLEVYFTNKTTR
jgi:hypothetical protein